MSSLVCRINFRSNQPGLKPISKRTIAPGDGSKSSAGKAENDKDRGLLPQILVKPGNGLTQSVRLVLGSQKKMAFARVNNELGRNA